MDLLSKLKLENPRRDNNIISIFGDIAEEDLVGIIVSQDGRDLTMSGSIPSGNEEEFFHLNKTQVGILISFLTELHKGMDND